MDRYIADTSSLIFAKENYPPENFPTLWEHLKQMNDEGRLIIIDKVIDEVNRGNDFLKTFVAGLSSTDSDEQPVVQHIPTVVGTIDPANAAGITKWLRGADPYLIASAIKLMRDGHKVTVLSEERESKIIRIPYCCRKLGVSCNPTVFLIREEKLVFRSR